VCLSADWFQFARGLLPQVSSRQHLSCQAVDTYQPETVLIEPALVKIALIEPVLIKFVLIEYVLIENNIVLDRQSSLG
jgi:hypothetical protein